MVILLAALISWCLSVLWGRGQNTFYMISFPSVCVFSNVPEDPKGVGGRVLCLVSSGLQPLSH